MRVLALTFLLAGLSSSLAHCDPPETKDVGKKALIIFGDSLSDNCNFFATFGNHTTPLAEAIIGCDTTPTKLYFKGRFTAAPGNWADQIDKRVSKLDVHNFAFGGATICDKNYTGIPIVDSIPNVQDQIKMYLAKLETDYEFAKSMKDRLRIPVIWGGVNDVQFTLKYNPGGLATLPAGVAECMKNATKLLLQSGHEVVVVGSLATIDLTPLVTALGPTVQLPVRNILAASNQLIQAMVAELQAQYPKQKVLYWDNNAAVTVAINNFAKLGFTFGPEKSCLTTGPNYSSAFGSIPLAVCKRPDEYIFWDDIHPTPKGHEVVTKSMVDFLKANGLATQDDIKYRRMLS